MELINPLLGVALVFCFAIYLIMSRRPDEEPCEGKSFAYCATCHRRLHDLCHARPPVDHGL